MGESGGASLALVATWLLSRTLTQETIFFWREEGPGPDAAPSDPESTIRFQGYYWSQNFGSVSRKGVKWLQL